jgi:four helix bundle protein
MHNFRRLLVWQKAHALVGEIERLALQIPRRDNTELVSQLRRAAVSIAGNIVTGCGRTSDKDFARYLGIALASAGEVEYYLKLGADTGVIPREEVEPLMAEVTEVSKMLVGLIRTLKRTRKAGV